MSQAGFRNTRVAGKMRVHDCVINRFMRRLQAIGMVHDHSRSDRPRKAATRENKLNSRYVRRSRFATSAHIRDELSFGDHVSVRTANIWFNEQRLVE